MVEKTDGGLRSKVSVIISTTIFSLHRKDMRAKSILFISNLSTSKVIGVDYITLL